MNAPMVGTHLPMLKETIAATMVSQMNAAASACSHCGQTRPAGQALAGGFAPDLPDYG
jgi:hypothetical protein